MGSDVHRQKIFLVAYLFVPCSYKNLSSFTRYLRYLSPPYYRTADSMARILLNLTIFNVQTFSAVSFSVNSTSNVVRNPKYVIPKFTSQGRAPSEGKLAAALLASHHPRFTPINHVQFHSSQLARVFSTGETRCKKPVQPSRLTYHHHCQRCQGNFHISLARSRWSQMVIGQVVYSPCHCSRRRSQWPY